MAKVKQVTLAIDFDGVVNRRAGKEWLPMDGALEALDNLASQGYRIIIHTCVAHTPAGWEAVQGWLNDHEAAYHDITAVKPVADLYIDDKGYRFTNWNDTLQDIGELLSSW